MLGNVYTEANSPTVLDASDVISLHLVSKKFLKIAHDNELWKSLVADSALPNRAGGRRESRRGFSHSSHGPAPSADPSARQVRHAARLASSHGPAPSADPTALQVRHAARLASATVDDKNSTRNPTRRDGKSHICSRNRSSWLVEDVNFYHEYIARHSPLSLSWLQNPSNGTSKDDQEVRGMGLFGNSGETVIAPLDDDSVCLWTTGRDVDAPQESHGRILARSKPGLLSAHGARISSSDPDMWIYKKPWQEAVVESVSIDNSRNRAYFAIQSGLHEVDLETLKLVSHHYYPMSICALSGISAFEPLTVATTASLHIHDHRHSGKSSANIAACERLDFVGFTDITKSNDLYRLLLGDTHASHAPLIHPPLSIAQFHSSQTIHVAGRFPSILTYDRRSFPKVHSTIHSGARLASLTSKSSSETNTLIACGEYNGKGSLELYHLSPSEGFSHSPSIRNRTSAASSKLLSVASHGNRIVFCDGDGMLNWVEEDGSTIVRRWNINSFTEHKTSRGLFAGPSMVRESDVARKLVPLNGSSKSELAIWTGEKIGIVSFRKKPRFGPWIDKGEDEDVSSKQKIEEVYERNMRRALERQADEVRFFRGLGFE